MRAVETSMSRLTSAIAPVLLVVLPLCLFGPYTLYAGNQAEFSTKRLENGTRLICVPKFRKTKQIVLMNLDTQHTFSYQFDCSYLMPAPTDHN